MRDLAQLLNTATHEQKSPLVRILDTHFCQAGSTEEIVRGIQWLHRNIFDDIQKDFSGESEAYSEVLATLLRKFNVSTSASDDCATLEDVLVRTVFEAMWQSFSTAQKLDYENTVEKLLGQFGKKKEWLQVGGVTGALLTAKAGGFGTYVLASSTLGGISGAFDLTLPFGLYKSVSSAISVVVGPVGWLALGIWGAYKLTGTNFQKLIPAAIYIAALRRELQTYPNKIIGRTVIPHDYEFTRGLRLL